MTKLIHQSKPIAGYERYIISTDGTIWDTKREVLKTFFLDLVGPRTCRKQYWKVNLANDKMVYKLFSVHRLLAEAFVDNPDNLSTVDHIDRDSTNNELSNLRWVNHQTNMKNKKLYRNSKSGYIGVCWNKRLQKWVAAISKEGKVKHIGVYDDVLEAAKAYNAVAIANGYSRINEL